MREIGLNKEKKGREEKAERTKERECVREEKGIIVIY